MTNHHMHEALARQRDEHIRTHPASPSPAPRVDWAAVAPVVSVLTGFAALLALAAPSL
jgi:hypothetical protein